MYLEKIGLGNVYAADAAKEINEWQEMRRRRRQKAAVFHLDRIKIDMLRALLGAWDKISNGWVMAAVKFAWADEKVNALIDISSYCGTNVADRRLRRTFCHVYWLENAVRFIEIWDFDNP